MKAIKTGLMATIIATALTANVSAAPVDANVDELKKIEQPSLMAKKSKPKSGGIVIRW